MKSADIKKIADILHTIFCGRDHETRVENFEKSPLCAYYVETSIDRCWELKDHKEWFGQAQLFIQLSHPISPVEILQDLVTVHKIATKIKDVNPKLLKYVSIIFK